MRNQILALFFLVFICLIAASCGRGAIAGPPMYSLPSPTLPSDDSRDLYDPIGGYPTQYWVYVEEIRMPDPVIENEPFVIEMRVSAEFRPKVLWGYQYADRQGKWANDDSADGLDDFVLDMNVTDREGYVHPKCLTTDCVLSNPVGEGPPVTTLRFRVPGLSAGSYEFVYFGTDKREYGGIGGPASEWGMQGDPELKDHVLMMFGTFEVVPAESAE